MQLHCRTQFLEMFTYIPERGRYSLVLLITKSSFYTETINMGKESLHQIYIFSYAIVPQPGIFS